MADRREAIALAVAQAQPGDIVLIAGKGHEQGQEIAGTVYPFDDRDEVRAAIAESLEATVLPGLRASIVTSKVSTPQDFHDQLWSYKGAGFGLEPVLLQSAWFRPHNRSEDVQGLYMVGASTHPGAGVPGVLMSAKALETVIPHASTFR